MIKYKKDTDNIVTLTLDMAHREVNIINHEVGKALLPVVQHLHREKAAGRLRGIIITSAKKTFSTGGDLDYLHRVQNVEEIHHYAENLKQLFRDLESPGVPVVAAINGSALGTGFELALACHHRIVLGRPNIRLGHPEVTLGLIPGTGGVIRLLWLLGVEKAFRVLTEGRRYTPKEALEVGIIDALADSEKDMLERAKIWLLAQVEGRRPWDRQDGRIPGGTARDNAVAQVIRQLAADLTQRQQNNYAAPQAILNILSEGSKVDFDTACRIESRYFTELVSSQESKNMIQAFWYDFKAVIDGASRPKGFGKFRPKKVGIIGSGVMGSGIAAACVMRGLEVILKDISKSVAERGKLYAAQRLVELAQEGKITEEDSSALVDKIQTTKTAADFEDCDLVIEAVFENRNVKTKVMHEAEMHMDEYSLFATNTSSIPIRTLAESSSRPGNFVGLHFFSPVEEVPIVEIIRGPQTTDETIARAFDFVNRIRKTPIIVKASWGFFASRVQNTYLLEGIQLLSEGYPAALIENVGRQLGMPKGPLALADDLGLDMALRFENHAAVLYGPQYIQHPAVPALVKMKDDLQRLGARKKAGFYDYPQAGERYLWTAVHEHFPHHRSDWSRQKLEERLLFVQVIEAVWCLQEKVLSSVPEANLGSIYGWGFPAFKGGVIQFINDYGVVDFLARCRAYEKEHGPRFKAPKLLRQMAAAAS